MHHQSIRHALALAKLALAPFALVLLASPALARDSSALPPAVSDAIFARIRSERGKKVADYESMGKKEAEDIRTAAERKSREMVAEARAEEARIKGQADADADRIRNEAFQKDPEFYAFLKKLEEYQRILGDRSVLPLSTHRALFDMLLQPPKPSAPLKKGEQ